MGRPRQQNICYLTIGMYIYIYIYTYKSVLGWKFTIIFIKIRKMLFLHYNETKYFLSLTVSFICTASSPAAGQLHHHCDWYDSRTSVIKVTENVFISLAHQIRLAGSGSTQCSGRVEIYYNITWGSVCDDDWDLNDATVVCRELGCGTALSAPRSAMFGEGSDQIWLNNVACSGIERSLTECEHRGFGHHNCEHNEDAGVICSGEEKSGSSSCNPLQYVRPRPRCVEGWPVNVFSFIVYYRLCLVLGVFLNAYYSTLWCRLLFVLIWSLCSTPAKLIFL